MRPRGERYSWENVRGIGNREREDTLGEVEKGERGREEKWRKMKDERGRGKKWRKMKGEEAEVEKVERGRGQKWRKLKGEEGRS